MASVAPAEAPADEPPQPSLPSQQQPDKPTHSHPELRRASAATAGRCISVVSVALPQTPFLCVWTLVLVTRGICASFLLTLSLLYAALSTTELEYYARLLSLRSCYLFRPISWLAACGSAANMYQICRILHCSIRARRPTFASPASHGSSAASGARSSVDRWLLLTAKRIPLCGNSIASVFKRLRFELFARQGFFGVESAYFELRFLVREFVEMLSQTVQVYAASTLIAKQWINHLYVAIVFTNSLSTPLVKHFTHHTPALERLMCLTADLALDLVTSVAVPLIIACPYAAAFDTTLYSFNFVNLYNPSWFLNLVMENRQVFVRNEFDLVLKVAPHMSIYGCLGSIQSLVRQRTITIKPTVSHRQIQPHTALSPSAAAAKAAPRKSHHGPELPEIHSKKSTSRTDTRMRRLSIRLRHMQRHNLGRSKSTLVHIVFILWGCTIVAFHSIAILSTYSLELCGCNLQLHPWFTTKCACSVFEYNCYRQGTTSPTDDSLAPLDEASLAVLVFSHCPELVVPKIITRFSKLTGVEIWNSTITEWSQEAGVTAYRHPVMTYICLVDVEMAGIPDGLLYDLPSELQDIEITNTNLTWIPDDLDVRWHGVKTLFIEYAELTHVPDVIMRMNVADFSLVGNHFATLPALTAGTSGSTDGYYTLSLSNNPLEKLPEYTGDLSDLFFLALENTKIRELPSWVDTVVQQGHHVFMYGTPFCNAKSAEEIATTYHASAVLTCSNANPRMMGRYPYEEMLQVQLRP